MNVNCGFETPTVLIVDDDPESLLLVSTMVEYIGYVAITAATFSEASEFLRQRPTALVLDLIMPDRTSEHLVAQLHESRADAVPVVLMSAAPRGELDARAAEYSELGINVVSTLAKPFWVDVLITALEKAMPDVRTEAIVGN